MKRRRITPRTAGGAVEASPAVTIGDDSSSYNYHHDQRAAAAAANLAKIPGVPVEHVSSFLHALRTTSKFFQTEQSKQPLTVVDWERLDRSNGRGESGNSIDSNEISSGRNESKNVHDSIMDRMKAISENQPGSASQNDGDRERKFVHVVNAWLEDVQLVVRRQKRNQQREEEEKSCDAGTATPNTGQQQPRQPNDKKQPTRSIPHSMFLYLWEMQQQHKWVSVRRSALFLSGLLLLRSKDCRFHVDQENHLADWISNIGVDAVMETAGSSGRNRAVLQLPFLHREAIALISRLIDKGYDSMYAKLRVAAKSLRHRCTSGLPDASDFDNNNSTTSGMANWRKLRDFALLHGRMEIQKVEKLLDRADECLEILVPRIEGVRLPPPSSLSSSRPTTTTPLSETIPSREGSRAENKKSKHRIIDRSGTSSENPAGNNDGSSDSEESDIDWEDGDDDIDDKNETIAAKANNERDLHLSAVERTMAAMEKTSETTLFDGGKLEIDFDKRVDGEWKNDRSCVKTGNDDNKTATNESERENKARKKLEKIVAKLSKRHLVRLSAWLDGLRNSDGLVRAESASLVSLSPENDGLRPELIRQLSVLKQEVPRILSSASRLNIQVYKSKEGEEAAAARAAGSNQTAAPDPTQSDVLALEATGPVIAARLEPYYKKHIPKKKSKQNCFRRIKIQYKKR